MDIWCEDVEKALLSFIPAHITAEYDQEGNYKPIFTTLAGPAQDFDDFHVFPRCAIQSLGEDFSYNRNGFIPSVTSRVGSLGTLQEPSQPYYLNYRITFYAKFKTDIDDIVKQWRRLTGRSWNLPITLTNGTPHDCATDLLRAFSADSLDREVRRYTRNYDYRIWVDLDGKTLRDGHIVTSINNMRR